MIVVQGFLNLLKSNGRSMDEVEFGLRKTTHGDVGSGYQTHGHLGIVLLGEGCDLSLRHLLLLRLGMAALDTGRVVDLEVLDIVEMRGAYSSIFLIFQPRKEQLPSLARTKRNWKEKR